MKLALTADLHLATRAEHPERYAALLDILKQMRTAAINTLIIAGDLFDASLQNYSEFESLCKENPDIIFLIIPGNHDPTISNRAIVEKNVHIFTKPEAVPFDPSSPVFFFLPYMNNKTMGDCIAEFLPNLPAEGWILIAHGDWMDGLREVNPYESGFYMPLARKDVNEFKPLKAFLGHIHAKMDGKIVYYAGSPCGMDINETGPRRFLVYDSHSGLVESREVDCEITFYNETLTILPLDDQETYISQKAQALIESWKLEPSRYARVQIRLKVSGFSTDREMLLRTLKQCFDGFSFYKGEEPDITAVSNSNDPDRILLAEDVSESIKNQTWPIGADEPSSDDILLAALDIIYGGK